MKLQLVGCLGMVVGLFMLSPVGAQDAETTSGDGGKPITFHLFWENDGGPLMRVHPSDRHYSNGTAVAVTHQPQWAANLADYIPFHESFGTPDRTGAGYTVGQLIFTPANIETTLLVPTDRPYAGYLYGGVFWQRVRHNTMDHFQLDVGVTGEPSLVEEAQELFHEWFDDVQPQGWDNQIDAEPTVQFTFRKKWKLDVVDEADVFGVPISVQAIPQLAAGLGTVYRYIDAGSVVRLGCNLPDDFGPRRLSDPGDATTQPGDGLSAYVFGQATSRFIEHDLFMEGSTFGDSHGVPIENVVGEFRGGATIAYRCGPWAIEITYAMTFKTREFEGQDEADSYGGFAASVTCEF